MRREIALLAAVCLCDGCAPRLPGPSHQARPEMVQHGHSRTADPALFNQDAPIRPDRARTPGDTLDVTAADVCQPGYSRRVRNVPLDVKRQVYFTYAIDERQPGEYEVDHLISLELGGSNSLRNLWPQSSKTHPWNSHVKDVLENRLHEMVCGGELDLKTAQQEIASDWIAAYKKYVGPSPGQTLE